MYSECFGTINLNFTSSRLRTSQSIKSVCRYSCTCLLSIALEKGKLIDNSENVFSLYVTTKNKLKTQDIFRFHKG